MPSELLGNERKLNEAPNNPRFPPDKPRTDYNRGAGGGYVVSEIGGQQLRQELDNRPMSRSGPTRRTELESPQSPRQPMYELDTAT